MKKDEYVIRPVGYVRVGDGGFRIEIEEEFVPALKELSGFSHVNVIWWCHLCDGEESRGTLVSEQPYRKGPDRIGVFATRSELRPNPVALTVAPVLRVDETAGVVHVAYIDTEDGTPVIDLKPYHPAVDRVRNVSVPEWCAHWPAWYEDSAGFDWMSEFTF